MTAQVLFCQVCGGTSKGLQPAEWARHLAGCAGTATLPDVATLYVRNISPEAVARIKRRAEARGLTVGAYLEALEALHGALLEDAGTGTGDPQDRIEWRLGGLGLGRVVD